MLPTSRVKRDAAAVGRDVDLLVDVGAVEQQRVEAVLALDRVAAVARVPDERVVAGAEQRRVVAAAADDDVVAVAAEQHVVAVAAGDVSLPAPPSTVSWISAARPLPAVKVSSPPLALSDEVLGGADVEGERGRGDAVEADARAVGGDGEGLGAVAAVDLDGVDAVAALD